MPTYADVLHTYLHSMQTRIKLQAGKLINCPSIHNSYTIIATYILVCLISMLATLNSYTLVIVSYSIVIINQKHKYSIICT